MEEELQNNMIPVSEDVLRTMARNMSETLAHDRRYVENEYKKLLFTARDDNISLAHRGAAFNALCSLIEQGLAAHPEFFLSRSSVRDILDVYLYKAEVAKSKPLKQLLGTLTRLVVAEAAHQGSDDNKLEVLYRVFEASLHQKARPHAKAALHALAHFIAKEVFAVEDVVLYFEAWQRDTSWTVPGITRFTQPVEHLMAGVLDWVKFNDVAPAAGHLISVIYSKGIEQRAAAVSPLTNGMPSWILPLEQAALDQPDIIQDLQNHVLPGLFKSSPNSYLQFLDHLRIQEHLLSKPPANATVSHITSSKTREREIRRLLLFAILQNGKQSGVVKEVEWDSCKEIKVDNGTLLIPDALIGRLLPDADPSVRLAGLSLLITSRWITKPLTLLSLVFLRKHLQSLHAEADSHFRDTLLSLTHDLFTRIRAAVSALSRNANRQEAWKQRDGGSSNVISGEPRDAFSAGQVTISQHIDLLRWYLDFILMELRPSSSYQRQITALKALTLVLASGLDPRVSEDFLSKDAQREIKWSVSMEVLDASKRRVLLDLLMNPYDDVRQGALTLLKQAARFRNIEDQPKRQHPVGSMRRHSAYSGGREVLITEQIVRSFIQRAETTMLLTGRADHADGVARAYDLMFELANSNGASHEDFTTEAPSSSTPVTVLSDLLEKVDKVIDVAKSDLSEAVNKYPMHGLLSSLRYIIDQPDYYAIASSSTASFGAYQQIHRRIIGSVKAVWECVRSVLCNDAPEGHVPDELEEGTDVSTKDILSYSWRALKESSILLRVLVIRSPYPAVNTESLLSISDFCDLGDLCFTQLAELRHRGAFSTVAQSFGACCSRFSKSSNEVLKGLVPKWYRQTILCIQDKGSVVTRRSAGIPSMMIAILTADPRSPSIAEAMADLQQLSIVDQIDPATEETGLPQVHALNCLKDIFISTKLAARSEPYIAAMLDLAADRLSSNIWAIRNCGLMLLRALIVDRLLGTNDRQGAPGGGAVSSRLSFEAYPTLLDVVLRLLGKDTKSPPVSEGVFAALQLLQRVAPPKEESDSIRTIVLGFTGDNNWHIRDMAARTTAALTPSMEVRRMIMDQRSTGSEESLNRLHGKALCSKYLTKRMQMYSTERHSEQPGHGESFMEKGVLTIADVPFHNVDSLCPFVCATYLQSLGLQIEAAIRHKRHWRSMGSAEWEGKTILQELVRTHIETFENTVKAFGRCVTGNRQPANGNLRDYASLLSSFAYYLVQLGLLNSLRPTDQFELLKVDSHVHGMLIQSARLDSETCLAAVDSLQESVQTTHVSLVLQCEPVRRWLKDLFYISESSVVKVSVLRLVYTLLIRSDPTEAEGILDTFGLRHGLEKHLLILASPSLYEAALKIRGFALDAHQAGHTTLSDHVLKYCKELQVAGEEHNPFDLRLAAVQSLSGLRRILSNPIPPSEVLYVLYDMLNDDDEEIREAAASIVTGTAAARVRFGIRQNLIPLAASKRLSEYIAKTYADDIHAASGIKAFRRMIDLPHDSRLGEDSSFTYRFAEARAEDNSLFVEEKQNLFKDPAREAVIWSRVLVGLTPRAIGKRLAIVLTEWVMDGLAAFTELASNQHDGPLGWSSKPEVFALGIQVIYGAEVLLAWRSKSRLVPKSGSDIRRALREFADALIKADGHPIWMSRIETVLEAAVLKRLEVLQKHLKVIQQRIL